MVSKKQVRQDLEDMCAQTSSHYLCYDDIHTIDYQKDADLFIKELAYIGYSKQEAIEKFWILPEFGGGFKINHQGEKNLAGYTINKKNNGGSLAVFSGFDLDKEKQTVYHECAHLFQFKYNLLGARYKDEYSTYQTEVHANVMATMIMLLRAKNVLAYKKEALCRIAESSGIINSRSEELLYYISLPVELELMRQIRRKGRKNVIKEFSTRYGTLNFKKIAFYTADLVQKYGFTREEFSKIKQKQFVNGYQKLKRKARTFFALSGAYMLIENQIYAIKKLRHVDVEFKRYQVWAQKIRNLPEIDEEAKALNAASAIDVYQTILFKTYGLHTDLNQIVSQDLSDKSERENTKNGQLGVKDIHQNIKDLYNQNKEKHLFLELFQKLNSFDTRDEVWALKARKEQQINNLISQSQKRSY